ncbi:MAG: hypothetical protein SWX82_28810 [Cyanobacteriota bacterium]|nr:hypothetical protein [Cyanobacteriota bacterium]
MIVRPEIIAMANTKAAEIQLTIRQSRLGLLTAEAKVKKLLAIKN